MGPVMLYWPGGGPVAASQMGTEEFLQEMSASLGKPLRVGSAAELLTAIRAS
jgi:hypothetical protein